MKTFDLLAQEAIGTSNRFDHQPGTCNPYACLHQRDSLTPPFARFSPPSSSFSPFKIHIFLTRLIVPTWNRPAFSYSGIRTLGSLAAASKSQVNLHNVAGNLYKQSPLKSKKQLFTVGLTICDGSTS
jgi:hypothetical protein